ncbi:MAG: hypothetical protein IT211_05040 [Armatimonadetes bacterium]|nr:hypothetical protein [Armatimonadota bacterium]
MTEQELREKWEPIVGKERVDDLLADPEMEEIAEGIESTLIEFVDSTFRAEMLPRFRHIKAE